MRLRHNFKYAITFLFAALLQVTGTSDRTAYSQESARVARIPGIDPGPCNPGPEENPWLNPNQSPGCRALEVIASMTLEEKVAGVIEAFYPGQGAGSSIARILFGDVNPSGKLAMTFPADESQGPGTFYLDYPGDGMTVNYSEGVLVGYRWYDARNQTPLFPFGHGLSYTTFQYGDLRVERKQGEQAAVSVRITNTGKRKGAEVVQLYIQSPPEAEEPPKQLKGFEKIVLEPEESRVVALTLAGDSFAAWDAKNHEWKVHPGTYSIMIGSSSRDIRLKASLDYP